MLGRGLFVVVLVCISQYLNAQTVPAFVLPKLLEVTDSLQKNKHNIDKVLEQLVSEPLDTFGLWKRDANLGFNFAQSGFYNWAGGGQSSISVSALGHWGAVRESKISVWENNLNVAYGVVRIGEIKKFRKTDDNLMFNSRYARTLKRSWKASAMVDFRTQLQPGYRYERIAGSDKERDIYISDFMAPGYLSISIGAEASKKDFYQLRLSPITGKITYVLQDSLSKAGAYGVEPGKRIRKELGAQLNASFKRKVMQNINLQSKALLFTGYENFGNIDINWEVILLLKVNKYVSSSFSTQLIYDDDIKIERTNGPRKGTKGPSVQFKELINIGVNIQF